MRKRCLFSVWVCKLKNKSFWIPFVQLIWWWYFIWICLFWIIYRQNLLFTPWCKHCFRKLFRRWCSWRLNSRFTCVGKVFRLLRSEIHSVFYKVPAHISIQLNVIEIWKIWEDWVKHFDVLLLVFNYNKLPKI